jgi:hypothetical protein
MAKLFENLVSDFRGFEILSLPVMPYTSVSKVYFGVLVILMSPE